MTVTSPACPLTGVMENQIRVTRRPGPGHPDASRLPHRASPR